MKILGFTIERTKAAPSGSVPVRSSLWGWVRESFPGAWQQGAVIDPLGTISSYGAVYACLTRIATDIAKLQPQLVVRQPDGTHQLAANNSPFWRVVNKPNHYSNRIQTLTQWLASKLMYGNAYMLKVREDARGIVTGYYPLDPRRVTPMVAPNGDVYYSLGGNDLAKIPEGMIVPATEIIHDRHITLWHPLVGVSPIYACAVSASQGMRIQSNSSKFFENMSRPSGMLTAPGTIDDVTAKRLKETWEQNYSNQNLGRLAVLGDGLRYDAMTIPAQDAQLIQQLSWTVEDIARAFAMPLYKINAGPMPTAGNVEALESQYYSGCLQVLIESIELCLTEGLELPSGMEVHLDLDGLLRMDSSTQIDMLAKAVGAAIMSPNEARQARNLPPTEGGDSVYLQQQNYSLAALARRDNQIDSPSDTSTDIVDVEDTPADYSAASSPQASINEQQLAAESIVKNLIDKLRETNGA